MTKDLRKLQHDNDDLQTKLKDITKRNQELDHDNSELSNENKRLHEWCTMLDKNPEEWRKSLEAKVKEQQEWITRKRQKYRDELRVEQEKHQGELDAMDEKHRQELDAKVEPKVEQRLNEEFRKAVDAKEKELRQEIEARVNERLIEEEWKDLEGKRLLRETEEIVSGKGRQGQKAIKGSAYLAPFLEDDTSSEDELPDKEKKVIEPELTSVEDPRPSEEDIVVPSVQQFVHPVQDTRNITTTGIQIISDMAPSRTGTALAPQPLHRLHISSAQVYSDVEPSQNVQGTTYTTGSRPEDLVISDVQVISNIPPTTGATPAPVPVVVRTTITQALPSYLLKFLMLVAILAMLFATLMGLGARRERDSWLAANEFTRRMAWHLRMGGGSGDGFGLLSWFLSDQSLNLKAGLYG